jgi:hypothetical protein
VGEVKITDYKFDILGNALWYDIFCVAKFTVAKSEYIEEASQIKDTAWS